MRSFALFRMKTVWVHGKTQTLTPTSLLKGDPGLDRTQVPVQSIGGRVDLDLNACAYVIYLGPSVCLILIL